MTSILISAILALFSCNINAYEFPLGHFLPQDTYILCFTMRDEKCSDLLINLITSAQKSIDMQAYHLTDKNIIAALIAAKKRGVKIRVIIDKLAVKKESLILLRENIAVWVDYSPRIAHNKIMIIDSHGVQTGSYNPTKNADEYNAENIFWLVDKNIVEETQKNFDFRLSQSKQLN